jgi:hypothetical protein
MNEEPKQRERSATVRCSRSSGPPLKNVPRLTNSRLLVHTRHGVAGWVSMAEIVFPTLIYDIISIRVV